MITARLVELRNMGISLAIDDFGMEYSSLNRIKSFPIDRLKIDMNFVQGILTNSKDRAIVEVIISLAKTLNLKVIAEGVEEPLHFEKIRMQLQTVNYIGRHRSRLTLINLRGYLVQ